MLYKSEDGNKKKKKEVKVKNYNTIKFIINEEGGRPHQLIPTTIS